LSILAGPISRRPALRAARGARLGTAAEAEKPSQEGRFVNQ
jgi:hypothetical protein